MTFLTQLAAVFGLSAAAAASGESTRWPVLPKTGALVRKPATEEDVKKGAAVFSMAGGSKGVLPIAVPQYVLWADEGGKKHPMVLVQAERAPDGSEIVGLCGIDGQETVATLQEVTLLGAEQPR